MTDLSPGPGSDEDFRTVLDRMADGFFALDADWTVTYANERGRRILRSAMRDDALGPPNRTAADVVLEADVDET